MNTYTLYWLDGKREIVIGDSPADAMNKAGYGQGSLKALDFYAQGEDNQYIWNKEKKTWERKGL